MATRKVIELPKIGNREVLAQQVIDNPVYKQSFDAIRAHSYEIIERSKPSQTDVREEAYKTLKTLKSVQKQLDDVMRSGKLKDAAEKKGLFK